METFPIYIHIVGGSAWVWAQFLVPHDLFKSEMPKWRAFASVRRTVIARKEAHRENVCAAVLRGEALKIW